MDVCMGAWVLMVTVCAMWMQAVDIVLMVMVCMRFSGIMMISSGKHRSAYF
jgi:hypothetical protein